MKKILFGLFIIIIVVGACGCMDTNVSKEYYILKIEEHLKSKYDEEFTVVKLNSTVGSDNDTVIQAWCKCTSGDYVDVEFMAQIQKESFEIEDSYINLYAADEISNSIRELYDEESIVLTQFETPNAFSTEKSITDVNDFLDKFNNYYITSFVFIKSELSNSDLSNKIFDYAKSLEKLDYRDLTVIVFVVNDLDKSITSKFYSSNEKYDEFISDINVKKYSGFQLDDSGLVTSLADIERTFVEGK